jgi:hypothetical protein
MGWLRWARREPIVATDGTCHSAAAFWVYGHLSDLPEDAVIGAGYAPGFAADLTCWRVFVSGAGRVREEVHLWVPGQGYQPEMRVEESDIGPDAASKLLRAAELAGVREMAAWYQSSCTDLEIISVVVRLRSGLHAVGAYGASDLAGQRIEEVVSLLGLWRAVQQVAPWHPPWWHSHL